MSKLGKIVATIVVIIVGLFILVIIGEAAEHSSVIMLPLLIGWIVAIKAIWKKDKSDTDNIDASDEQNDDSSILQK